MLKRFCDRCGTEMEEIPVLSADDWILRRVNHKPLELCPVCQKSLNKWMISSLDDWYESKEAKL